MWQLNLKLQQPPGKKHLQKPYVLELLNYSITEAK